MLKTTVCGWCARAFEYDTMVRHGKVRYCKPRHYYMAKLKRRREAYANGKK